EKFKDMKTWFVEQPGQLFSLHSKEKSHYFFRTRGDMVTNEAVEQGMDKATTKQIMKENQVPIPAGKEFTQEDSREEILAYAIDIGYPVVLKPTEGSFGRGVISNISSEGELIYSLDYLLGELNKEKVILEKYIYMK